MHGGGEMPDGPGSAPGQRPNQQSGHPQHRQLDTHCVQRKVEERDPPQLRRLLQNPQGPAVHHHRQHQRQQPEPEAGLFLCREAPLQHRPVSAVEQGEAGHGAQRQGEGDNFPVFTPDAVQPPQAPEAELKGLRQLYQQPYSHRQRRGPPEGLAVIALGLPVLLDQVPDHLLRPVQGEEELLLISAPLQSQLELLLVVLQDLQGLSGGEPAQQALPQPVEPALPADGSGPEKPGHRPASVDPPLEHQSGPQGQGVGEQTAYQGKRRNRERNRVHCREIDVGEEGRAHGPHGVDHAGEIPDGGGNAPEHQPDQQGEENQLLPQDKPGIQLPDIPVECAQPAVFRQQHQDLLRRLQEHHQHKGHIVHEHRGGRPLRRKSPLQRHSRRSPQEHKRHRRRCGDEHIDSHPGELVCIGGVDHAHPQKGEAQRQNADPGQAGPQPGEPGGGLLLQQLRRRVGGVAYGLQGLLFRPAPLRARLKLLLIVR